MPKEQTGKVKITSESQKKAYVKPEILSHESLERVAAGCGKGPGAPDVDACTAATFS